VRLESHPENGIRKLVQAKASVIKYLCGKLRLLNGLIHPNQKSEKD
jgi:hypothetical protein